MSGGWRRLKCSWAQNLPLAPHPVCTSSSNRYALFCTPRQTGISGCKPWHLLVKIVAQTCRPVGQFSWFAWVKALCNFSCKQSWEVATSLPGWILSRRCFTLCTTMEVEPRLVQQYQHCCNCKNYWGKGMEGGKKRVFVLFFGWPEDRDFMEKMRFRAAYSTSSKLLFVARHILTMGLQKYL